MSNEAYSYDDVQADQGFEEPGAPVADAQGEDYQQSAMAARPVPRISIQCFCDDPATADAIQYAAQDRRLSKAQVSVHMGGVAAAVSHYQESPTPNLIVIESLMDRDAMVHELDQLAECCDAGTKVIVIGHVNDVILYRELLKRGVSEYIVAPVQPITFMEGVSNLYNDPDSEPVGHVIAFVGAKGGVGSSTICHNIAWTITEQLQASAVVADFDLAFGTTGLDFNQDPVQGIAEALSAPERLDDQLLDRLLTKCTDHLSIFAAPVILDRDYDMSADACESVIDVVRQNVPYVIVDVPHNWTSWSKRLLLQADEVVVTAAPDLANLRNAKNIFDLLKQSRTNDRPPHLVLNTVNMPKRPEISVAEFCQGLDIDVSAVLDFDSETFGAAANNGQMIEELNRKAKSVSAFHELSMTLTHRDSGKSGAASGSKSALAPLLEKFKLTR